MATVACPHCGVHGIVPEGAGPQVRCRHCSWAFTILPPEVSAPPLPAPAAFVEIATVPAIVPAPQATHYAERLKARGWFSRGFAGSFGVGLGWGLASLLVSVLTVGGVVLVAVLLFRGVMAEADKAEQEYRQLVMDALGSHGFKSIAENGTIEPYTDAIHYTGAAIDRSGNVRNVDLWLRVAKFKERTTIKIAKLSVDGESRVIEMNGF